MRLSEALLVACDTCLGRRPSRTPHLVLAALASVAACGWFIAKTLVDTSVRRRAIAGAAGCAIVLASIVSVTVIPVVGQPGVACSSAMNATAMRHFGSSSYWDESGCDAAGWRRIHQAQLVGSAGLTVGLVSLVSVQAGLRGKRARPPGLPVGEPAS